MIQSNRAIVVCAGNRTALKYRLCSVLSSITSHAAFKAGESNPRGFSDFSASCCSHLSLCSYPSAAVIILTESGDDSRIITFYLKPCHAGKMAI